MNKSLGVVLVAIIGMLVIALVGVPYGNFTESAFAQYTGNGPGSSSVTANGVTINVVGGPNGCEVSIAGNTSTTGITSALGSGLGSFTLVKNTQASQSSNFQVLQLNGPGNTPAFEIWINKTTGGCSVKLP